MGLKLNLTMGARNGAKNTREENDFYIIHSDATRAFLDKLKEDRVKLSPQVWECACGQGHIAEVLKEYGHRVFATDLIDRGYGNGPADFLEFEGSWNGDIITNPPFKLASEFVRKAHEIMQPGSKLCLFLKIQFLESKERRNLFATYPPKYVYVYSERQQCSKDADFENLKAKTQCYCWVIWEKYYFGETVLRWI